MKKTTQRRQIQRGYIGAVTRHFITSALADLRGTSHWFGSSDIAGVQR